jgi:hypothetical protein
VVVCVRSQWPLLIAQEVIVKAGKGVLYEKYSNEECGREDNTAQGEAKCSIALETHTPSAIFLIQHDTPVL